MPVDIKVDLEKLIKTSFKNPFVSLKVMTLLIAGTIMTISAYFGAKNSPYVFATINSMLAVGIIVAVGVSFMYLDIYRFGRSDHV